MRQLLQFRGEEKDTLRLEGAANARDGRRELLFQESACLFWRNTFLQRTFEDMSEHKAKFLKLGQHSFMRLLFGGDFDCLQKRAGLALKGGLRGVEKIGVMPRSDAAQKKGLNVNRAKASGPFETLEAAGDVGWRGKLAAAVTGKKS